MKNENLIFHYKQEKIKLLRVVLDGERMKCTRNDTTSQHCHNFCLRAGRFQRIEEVHSGIADSFS